MKIARITLMTLAVAALAAVPAFAGSTMEKTLSLQPGGKFVLDTNAGSVSIVASSEPGVVVRINTDQENVDKLLRVRATERIGYAKLEVMKSDSHVWEQGVSVKYEIRVPAGTALDITTPSSSLRVPALDANSRVATSGGKLAVLPAGEVRAAK